MKKDAKGGLIIPASFVRRAMKYIAEYDEPLLTTRFKYVSILDAWPDEDGGSKITDPCDEWERPFYTYRGCAEYSGMSLSEVMEEHGLDEGELDTEIDEDIVMQMVNPEDGPGVTSILDDLPDCDRG